MKTMIELIRELTPLNRAVCAQGYDKAVEVLCHELPFQVRSIPQSVEHNGWIIPPAWDVEEAEISLDQNVVYDGTHHPLAVISLSSSFIGEVELEELKRHIHFDHRNSDSIPFHYRQQFRSWERDWGFCMPKSAVDALTPGKYTVRIRTREGPGSVKILEYRHHGATDHVFVLGANLDHAGVANDGLSGVAVGIEVMRRLAEQRTKFAYALVLSPGILGTELYLGSMPPRERAKIVEGMFLEMLGTENSLAVQESRHSMVSLSHAIHTSLQKQGIDYRHGSFEEIIINDEYLYENYGIPMLSLSRFPYAEYHSSRDSAAIMREPALEEAVEAVLGMIQHLESSPILVKRFTGNMCLSNQQYDLYIDYGQIAFGQSPTDTTKRLRALMDFIPSLERPVSVAAVAHRMGLDEATVMQYLIRWQEKGLIALL